jgi:hypothetical protein
MMEKYFSVADGVCLGGGPMPCHATRTIKDWTPGVCLFSSLFTYIFLCLFSSFCVISRSGILWLSRSRIRIGFNADTDPDTDPGFVIPTIDKICISSLSLPKFHSFFKK